MFCSIFNDFEIYLKTEKEKEKELNISHLIKEIIEEVKKSQNLNRTIMGRGRQSKGVKKEAFISHSKNNSHLAVNKLYSSNNLNTTFSIFNSNFTNYFNQSSLKNFKKCYNKYNEIELLRANLVEKISQRIKEKIYNSLIEKHNSIKKINVSNDKFQKTDKFINFDKVDKLEKFESPSKYSTIKKNTLSHSNSFSKGIGLISFSTSFDENFIKNTSSSHRGKPLNILKNNIFSKKNSSPRNNINRLYPEPTKAEDILTFEFVQKKILEYKFNGLLHKKVDLKDFMKIHKISSRKDYEDINIKENMKIAEMLFESYSNTKNIIEKSSKRQKSVYTAKPSTKFYNRKLNNDANLIETNSNFYCKVDRSKVELNCDFRKKNKKTIDIENSETPNNIQPAKENKNNKKYKNINFHTNFYNNVKFQNEEICDKKNNELNLTLQNYKKCLQPKHKKSNSKTDCIETKNIDIVRNDIKSKTNK